MTNLLNAVGTTLKPKVFCVSELAHQGPGHPDLGLYAAKQVQRGQPREGQTPEGGVVEVKAAHDDAWLISESSQVSRYWDRYRLVLITNTRDFVLMAEDAQGRPAKLETFRLAGLSYVGKILPLSLINICTDFYQHPSKVNSAKRRGSRLRFLSFQGNLVGQAKMIPVILR